MKAVKIYVAGMVQGVGFRPFIRRIAYLADVRGYVKNLGGGEVEIHVEANDESRIENFLKLLSEKKPPPARIEKMEIMEAEPLNLTEFKILKSGTVRVLASEIPQDLAVCEDCLREALDPKSRWYMYPFNSCAWCGPRYSMIYKPPYDRENTAMRDFPLCEECRREYEDLWNERRYHAQGISCPKCGPKLTLLDKELRKIDVEDPLSRAVELIESGAILAIKGLGGYHIACLASDDQVVLELRRRKKRPRKPFAIMALNLEVVERLVEIPDDVRNLLTGFIKPIIILPKKLGSPVSDYVAPSLNTLGVMLPYTPLHYLLLRKTRDKFLIMTSGNIHGDPMVKDEEKLKDLMKIADYALIHNRKIVHRVDDSVVRPTYGGQVILRYGRGYAPRIMRLSRKLVNCVIAYGAELETAGAIGFDDKIILAQYSGDTDNPRVLDEHEENLKFLSNCYGLHERGKVVVAADMHPSYRSRAAAEKFSAENGFELKLIQHHFAHIASVMAENDHDPEEPAVGIAMDGVGYGLDGAIWGGEVITWDDGWRREGFLEYVLMPGGDLAALRPARMLASILSKFMTFKEIEEFFKKRGLLKGFKYGEKEFQAVLNLIEKSKKPLTSSTGRFLDSVSALLNLCFERTYEGEPAIMLEDAAIGGKLIGKQLDVSSFLKEGGQVRILTSEIMKYLIENLDESRKDLAYTAQYILGACLGTVAAEKARELGVKTIYVSGGAAVNYILLKAIAENSELSLKVNRLVPPGDGGIAVGQVYAAGLMNSSK